MSFDPRSRPAVITIFAGVVFPSVRPSVPTFQNLAKQNNFQVRIVIATGRTVGLAEWIIYGIHVFPSYFDIVIEYLTINEQVHLSKKITSFTA